MTDAFLCLCLPDVVAEETDDKMVEFAIGGLCNCCLGKTFTANNDLKMLIKFVVL